MILRKKVLVLLFVIFAGFQIARLMQGWHDRIPYRTGGFEYGYKLYH